MSDQYPQGSGPDGGAWKPAGPVVEAYGLSRAPLAVCIGPTGGGKTTESIRRYIRIAQWQHPSPIDGLRKARILVVGTTYRRVWDQIIPSYLEEIPWAMTKGPSNKWTGARGDPADHHFTIGWQGFGLCYIEVLFRAVGETDLEQFFQGFQCTAVHIPELTTWESGDVISKAANRVGRYPKPDDRPDEALGLPDAYQGVFADANAPEIGTWAHERFYLQPRAGDAVFIQPPGYDPDSPDGFHPQAENAANLKKLSRTYYRDRAAQHEPWDVRRLLQNKPGYSRHGQPVHAHFSIERHVSRSSIPVDPAADLVIGVDAGSNTLRPSAVFKQRTFGGQVRSLAEVVPRTQLDMHQFCEEIVRIRTTRFAAIPNDRVVIVVDPAARSQSAMKKGVTWAQVIGQLTGLAVIFAPSQAQAVRMAATDTLLKRDCAPGEPAFVVSGPECPGYIEALAGGYRFKRTGDKLSPTPDKTTWHADVADAGQYGDLGIVGVPGLASGVNRTPVAPAHPARSQTSLLPD